MLAPGHTRGRISISLGTPFTSTFPAFTQPHAPGNGYPSTVPPVGGQHFRGARSISISGLPPSARRTLPPELLLLLVLSGSLLAVSAHVGKLWLVDRGTGVVWSALGACVAQAGVEAVLGGLVPRGTKEKADRAGRHVPPPKVNAVRGMGERVVESVLRFAEVLCAMGMFVGFSATTVVLITQFVDLASLVPSLPDARLVLAPLLLTLLSTFYPPALPAFLAIQTYASLLGFALCVYTRKKLAPVPGAQSTAGAAAVGLVVVLLSKLMGLLQPIPPPSTLPLFLLLATSALLTPHTRRAIADVLPLKTHATISLSASAVLAGMFGALAFRRPPGVIDIALFGSLVFALRTISSPSPLTLKRSSNQTLRLIRTYITHIWNHPESRRIFLFLLVNLAYMLVQMLYGVWTNSLGLISDAIHMAFDCLSIALGLTAAVMAKWRPNDRFTYGYGRIETLSGFANGIFLILISVFIVFEAVQRLLDPPEMNTNQLLLVSSLGLAVNLFGMFATGGHAHHHHGHSHGHDHIHAMHPHSHDEHTEDHENGHGHHEHEHHHGHDHGHKHEHKHAAGQPHDGHEHAHIHRDDCEHGKVHHGHDHDHGHTNGHAEHSHSHGNPHAHEHEHEHEHGHAHSSHSHSHGEHAHPHSTPSHSHVHDHAHDSPGMDSDTSALDESPTPARPHQHQHQHTHRPASLNLVNGREAPSATILINAPGDYSPIISPGGHRALDTPIVLSSPPDESHFLKTPRVPAFRDHDEEEEEHGHDHGHHEHDHAHADDHHHGHSHAGHEPAHKQESHPHAAHGGHGHDHGHSHNMRGVFLHVMADTLGSVGVIISTLLIKFYGWTGFDPIASIFIAVLIAASVIPLVIDSGRVLALDVGTEREAEIRQALSELSSVEGLASYSAARFWPKDAEALIGTIHIQLAVNAASRDPGGPHSVQKVGYADLERVVKRVENVLKSRLDGLEELSVQVERSVGQPFCSCRPKLLAS